MSKPNNYAFIDSQNLNLGVKSQGWLLDFKRFRVFLRDKYYIEKAFLFIGYVVGNQHLYTSLQEAGYIICATHRYCGERANLLLIFSYLKRNYGKNKREAFPRDETLW